MTTCRRAFIAGLAALFSAPLAAQDRKDAPREYRIGVLDTIAEPANLANMDQLRKGLKDLGYVEGKNLRIEYRTAEGRSERYPALAAELAGMKVDLIVANGTPATMAAKNVPGMIPVVTATALDPVETGLVASLERPGGNVTGVAVLTQELEKKRIELLSALAPGRKRIAVLVNMGNPGLASSWKVIEAAAKSMGLEPELIDLRRPQQVSRAIDTAITKEAKALVVRIGALPEADRRNLVELAAKHRLPAIYAQRQYVDAGGLVSYGLSTPDMYYRAATFVDKILKGAKPGELAMERPSKFELVINRKTLRALDLVIPPDLLLRSNEIVG
jgi:putative tryptophan/tyrosine transport system substrate-binding protein